MYMLLGFLILSFGLGLVAERPNWREPFAIALAAIAVASVYYFYPRAL